MTYEQLILKSYAHWDVVLHENQCYLGRVFLALRNDHGIEDFLAIPPPAREEFFLVGNAVKSALKTLFQPDKFNYAALSNTSSRIHVHLIPRYKSPRTFVGTLFTDPRFGKNYAPYDTSFSLPPATLLLLHAALSSTLSPLL